MKIRDRILRLDRVRASDLLPNPKNWRTHPETQADALRGILAEVGFADALLAREIPGGLQLIDGHCRAEISPDSEVPVLVLDLNEREADLLLASLDPLAAMAETDADKLEVLLQDISTSSEAMQQMLDRLAQDNGIVPPEFQPVGIEQQGKLDEKRKATCPECGHEFTP